VSRWPELRGQEGRTSAACRTARMMVAATVEGEIRALPAHPEAHLRSGQRNSSRTTRVLLGQRPSPGAWRSPAPGRLWAGSGVLDSAEPLGKTALDRSLTTPHTRGGTRPSRRAAKANHNGLPAGSPHGGSAWPMPGQGCPSNLIPPCRAGAGNPRSGAEGNGGLGLGSKDGRFPKGKNRPRPRSTPSGTAWRGSSAPNSRNIMGRHAGERGICLPVRRAGSLGPGRRGKREGRQATALNNAAAGEPAIVGTGPGGRDPFKRMCRVMPPEEGSLASLPAFRMNHAAVTAVSDLDPRAPPGGMRLRPGRGPRRARSGETKAGHSADGGRARPGGEQPSVAACSESWVSRQSPSTRRVCVPPNQTGARKRVGGRAVNLRTTAGRRGMDSELSPSRPTCLSWGRLATIGK
jgi:hypothetical protein